MTKTIATPADPREAVGQAYSAQAMLHARERSMQAVQEIGRLIRPGMTEHQAREAASAHLLAMGIDRIWHPTIVRFGPATLKTFKQASEPGRVLGADDIYFVDIGPVWDGHEGDAGDTFVTGSDRDMQAAALAARQLWREVSELWRTQRLSGADLYVQAAQRAEALGWRLNLDIKGHRVSDFPHAIYKAGSLGDFGLCPDTGIWILEIQIAHPQRPFGAFYEDILMRDDAAACTSAPQAA